MPRLRITITTVVEYDANPDNYNFTSAEEMLALDVSSAKEEPNLFMDMNGAETRVVGELLEAA